MSWKCPECEEYLEYIKYSVDTSGREYGIADLNNSPSANVIDTVTRSNYDLIEDYSCDDNDGGSWEGSPDFECPHCNHTLDINDIVWEIEETPVVTKMKAQLQEGILEETIHNIIGPTTKIIDNSFNSKRESSIICKECKHLYVYNTGNRYDSSSGESSCPKCGTENTVAEFQLLAEEGFFDKKPIITKKNDKKNTSQLRKLVVRTRRAIHRQISGR